MFAINFLNYARKIEWKWKARIFKMTTMKYKDKHKK